MGRGTNGAAVVEPTRPIAFGIFGEDWPVSGRVSLEAERLAFVAQGGRVGQGNHWSSPEEDAATVLDVSFDQLPLSQEFRVQSPTHAVHEAPEAPLPRADLPFRGYIPGQRPSLAPQQPPARPRWVSALLLVLSLWALLGMVGALAGVVAASLMS